METGKEIRFKVEEIIFNAPSDRPDPKTSPPPSNSMVISMAKTRSPQAMAMAATADLNEQPMIVIGQAADNGLGMISWWS